MNKRPLSETDKRSIKLRKQAWWKQNRNRVLYSTDDLSEIKTLLKYSDLINSAN